MASAFKFVNKRETKRIAAPVTAKTNLSPAEVEHALEVIELESIERAKGEVAARETKGRVARFMDTAEDNRHLYLTRRGHGSYYVAYPVEATVKCKDFIGRWAARVDITETTEGGCEVTSALYKWITKEGALKNKEQYFRFFDRLAEALNSTPQSQGAVIAVPSTDSQTPAQTLEAMAELRKRGVITEEEFGVAKRTLRQ